VLSRPEGLDDHVLTAALTREWGIAVAALEHRPVGFGSHHWAATDPGGGRWFVTVDDLAAKRWSAAETLDDAYRRLRRSLRAARGLRNTGAAFVVAPLPTAGGDPVTRLTTRYAAAVYPYVEGESFGFGAGYADAGHRDAVLDMVLTVHAAPDAVCRLAGADDFGIAHRDALEAAVDGTRPADTGPYALPAADLLEERADAVRAALARYDALAARADPQRAVLTHGEPHPGNTLRTPAGWRLIDWDTALVAPPERDLWMLGDEAAAAYARTTGTAVLPDMLRLYRLRWDIADLAVGVQLFAGPHSGSADDDETWAIVQRIVTALPAR
jgi:spectinomycin phosphotransferase/16S rRNA (guanine(1405)-N(7))-methyltransferase